MTKFLDCLLDSILISLIISGLLLVFGVFWLYSFIAGGVYLVWGFIKSAKKASLSEIEKRIPNLEWQLRTAADNVDKRNELVERLNLEVSQKIGFVSFRDLISGKRTLKRMFFILLFGAGIFYMHATGFNLIKAVTNDNSDLSMTGAFTGIFFEGDVKANLGNPDDILGEASDINLGKRKLDVEVTTEASEIDLSKEQEVSLEKQNGKAFDGSVAALQDSSFSENIDSEEKEIVENFYSNLNK